VVSKVREQSTNVMLTTAWSMLWGTLLVVFYVLLTGQRFVAPPSLSYTLGLFYLALFGSVIAFGLYFTIARARGYAVASYISALTPPIAMLVSVMFEGARFGVLALVGLALVLAGQLFLIRAPKRSAA